MTELAGMREDDSKSKVNVIILITKISFEEELSRWKRGRGVLAEVD